MTLGACILESPKWLASQGRTDEAKDVLKRSRGYLEEDAEAELDEILRHGGEGKTPLLKVALIFAASVPSFCTTCKIAGLDDEVPSVWKVVSSEYLRRPLLAAVLLTVTQQLSGIDSVFYYSSYFFKVCWRLICLR